MDDSARIGALEMRVADLEHRLAYVMQQLNMTYTAEPLSPPLAEAANWLRQGNKIRAVQAYQKMTGQGLKESKDAVDALEKKLSAG